MSDAEADKLVREAILVQGDGRPFSTGLLRPQAIVRHAMVRPLVDPLGLAPEEAVTLTGRIAKAMRRYLGSVMTDERHAGHAGSRRRLDLIARTSKRLAEQLAALDYLFQNEIEQHRFEDSDQVEQRPFELQLLVPQLERLSRSASRAKAASVPNRDGPPGHDLLVSTVAELLPALEKAGLKVSTVESGSALNGPRRRVEGDGGALMLSIFALFDPSVGRSAIWSAIDKIRKTDMGPTRQRSSIRPATV